MPGVVVTTAVQPGPSTPLAANSGQFFVAGLAERGPVDSAVLVRGLADFEGTFGDRTTYSHLYDSVKTFFEEGGTQAYVARVAGPAATSGSVTVNDREATTPVPTLTFTAKSPGTWSENYSVTIEDGVTDTVNVIVSYNGTKVESYRNLPSPSAIVAAMRNSTHVTVTDQGSVTAAPLNNPAAGSYDLSAGTDDRSSVTQAEYQKALNYFVIGYGTGSVALPGFGLSAHQMLIEHATANRRIALLSMAEDASVADLTSTAAGIDSDAAGLFAPWVQVADNVGGVRSVPPEGYVAGARAKAHAEVGPWRVPAGRIAASAGLAGLVVEYTGEEADLLDDSKVSVIRRVSNSVRLYGWRSLSNDVENFSYLNARDLLNYLTVESERLLEDYVFAPVDSRGHLLSAINGTLVGLVDPISQAGGLYARVDDAGDEIDPGYVVKTGPEVNSTASLAQNEVRALMGVRISPTGALISLTIVKVGILSGF